MLQYLQISLGQQSDVLISRTSLLIHALQNCYRSLLINKSVLWWLRFGYNKNNLAEIRERYFIKPWNVAGLSKLWQITSISLCWAAALRSGLLRLLLEEKLVCASSLREFFPEDEDEDWFDESSVVFLYLNLLKHVLELNQELLSIFSFVRDTVQGLGDLALQGQRQNAITLIL